MFAILQKYDFSSKSQPTSQLNPLFVGCLRYCKSTIFQANHNPPLPIDSDEPVVCDTAKVRFFKQITTPFANISLTKELFAILQKYDFSSKSQLGCPLLKILQSCLRYCKSTIFQANHNIVIVIVTKIFVVCDTAKVRFFKQITTGMVGNLLPKELFAILQKYDFSSKSQPDVRIYAPTIGCLRYCKSTIFQANHNVISATFSAEPLFAILQKYDFSSKSQQER